jgi:hypothetical protein
MTKTSIAFLAALSLAGSGCHKNKGEADKAGAIARLTELRTRMCACKDRTCSDRVSAELAEWGQQEEKSESDRPVAPGDKDSEKLEALKDEVASCLLKIEVPGGAGTPGAPGAPAAAGSNAGEPAGGGAAADRAGGSAAPAAGSAAPAAGSAH